MINDKGNVPRGAPGDLYLAASGPLVPLRLVQTGPDRLDGPRNVRCEGPATKDETPTLRSETRMSAFNKAIRIDTPAGVLDLNQDGTTLGGQA